MAVLTTQNNDQLTYFYWEHVSGDRAPLTAGPGEYFLGCCRGLGRRERSEDAIFSWMVSNEQLRRKFMAIKQPWMRPRWSKLSILLTNQGKWALMECRKALEMTTEHCPGWQLKSEQVINDGGMQWLRRKTLHFDTWQVVLGVDMLEYVS